MSSKSRVLWYGSAAVLVVVGLVGGIAFGGTFGQLFAFVLIAVGLVLVVGLVFYEVGLSEDRERAREEAERRKASEPRPARPRRRLERRRGERRRLD